MFIILHGLVSEGKDRKVDRLCAFERGKATGVLWEWERRREGAWWRSVGYNGDEFLGINGKTFVVHEDGDRASEISQHFVCKDNLLLPIVSDSAILSYNISLVNPKWVGSEADYNKLNLVKLSLIEEVQKPQHIDKTLVKSQQSGKVLRTVETGCKGCIAVQQMEEQSLPLTALVSFPGSGNTWMRMMVEAATGWWESTTN